MFEHPVVRFATSGSLITCYGIADVLVRRLTKTEAPARMRLRIRVAIAASIAAFYCLIGPAGGPLLAGAGNAAGIALVGLAIAVRSSRAIPRAELAGRCIFYLALPLAVGVPWGFAVMTLPACALSLYSYYTMYGERPAGIISPHGAGGSRFVRASSIFTFGRK